MDSRLPVSPKADDIIPGVIRAYERLRADNERGLYTSAGRFYNHTFFGRDSSMSAKFVTGFDHEVAKETIVALSELQGVENNHTTQEEPGRIHHELREFSTWTGTIPERLAMLGLSRLWGGDHTRLLTYFSADATASYVRLVHKYAHEVDRAIVDQTIVDKNGDRVTVAQCIERAVLWVTTHTEDGIFSTTRSNRWGYPFQTFQDSFTAYPQDDGNLVRYRGPLAYIETQAFAIDALYDAAELLNEHERAADWRHMARRMSDAFFQYFWEDKNEYFSAVLDMKDGAWRHHPVRNISVGWTLNTRVYDHLSEAERGRFVEAVTRQLFSDDSLTPVGIRTRANSHSHPLSGVIDYHGPHTVWPMFNFMVAEGLRHQGLPRLATQIDNRTINGLNWDGKLSEFFIVFDDGVLARARDDAGVSLPIQMLPEHDIAFSVVPGLVLAHRLTSKTVHEHVSEVWQRHLEDSVLTKVLNVQVYDPHDAVSSKLNSRPIRYARGQGILKSLAYIAGQSMRSQR